MTDILARVFPRRTKATPTDALVFARPPRLQDFSLGITAVHVSVAFTWDKTRAERMAALWEGVAPVTLGGPAYDAPGGDFEPGRYLRPGYTITSRGCPNACWFCKVPKRKGRAVRQLPIIDGHNVLDDNLLACSDRHVAAVFAMLARQKNAGWAVEFTGGLEAARLTDYHVGLLADLRPKQMFFAFDTPDDWEPLVDAARRLLAAGLTAAGHTLRCYVLVGYPGDDRQAATARLECVCHLGLMPMAMLYRDDANHTTKRWRQFQRTWANPTICATKMREVTA